MSYYFSKTLNVPFDDAIAKVKEELKKEGFGVLTEINVKNTLKEKMNVEFKKYQILGACNPAFAYEALKSEEHIGLMMPCNVVVQESGSAAEVSAIDPVASMGAVKNEKLLSVAQQVQEKLKAVIDSL